MTTLIQVPSFVANMLNRIPKHKRAISVMEWLKADGETVSEDDTVIVLHTVKAAVELAAQASGLLFHLKDVNEKLKVGDVVGVVVDTVEEFQVYKKQNLTNVA